MAEYYHHEAGKTRPFIMLTRDLDGDCTLREISTGAVQTRDIFELIIDRYPY